MASVRPYRQQGRRNHWECSVSLGPDPKRPGRYLRKTFVLCPASCLLGCSPYPDYPARTKREAEQQADRIASLLREGADLQRQLAAGPTFESLVGEWLAWLEVGKKSRNTLRSYESIAKLHLLPTFGHRPAADITTGELQRHLDALHAGGMAPATCERVLTVARQAYRWGVQREKVPANPAREVDRPTQGKRRVDIPDRDTVLLVLGILGRAERTRWLGVFAVLAAYTGARRGELCALRWRDVDLEAGTMRVAHSVNRWREIKDTKTHAERTVPLAPTAVAALQVWRDAELAETRRVEGDVRDLPGEWLVFPSDDGPTTPRNPDAVSRAVARAIERFRKQNPGVLGDDVRVWMHGFRHFAASQMMAAGVSPADVAEVLGHSSNKVTVDTYGHGSLAGRRAAVDRLDRALGGGDREA